MSDAGNDATAQDSGNGGGDGAPDGAPEGGVDAGNPCPAQAVALCDTQSTCDPAGLEVAYGDLATCISVVSQQCSPALWGLTDTVTGNPLLPTTNGINDPTACLAAFTASCDSYFETLAHLPLACLPKNGNIADGATGCGDDWQCVAGDVCNTSCTAYGKGGGCICSVSTCMAATPAKSPCMGGHECAYGTTGLQCLATGSGTSPVSDGVQVCQMPVYGNLGDPCLANTQLQCKSAFYCGANNTCVAKLGQGQACDYPGDGCNDRLHLACNPMWLDSGAPTSSGICNEWQTVVPSGSQCGLVGGTNLVCQGNLYCDTTAYPGTCKPRLTQGTGCNAGIPDECSFGLQCSIPPSYNAGMGTCEPPPAPTPPPTCM
jgi:hypothetical protein